jgi:hypothetical protein
MKRLSAIVVLSVVTLSASADGFDPGYTAHVGDLNTDGLTDIYLKHRPKIVFVSVDDIATPIVTNRTDVAQFVLQNQGNGTFSVVSPSAAQLTTVQSWPEAPLRLRFRDVNFDGRVDVHVEELKLSTDPDLSSAFDMVVYAAQQDRVVPTVVTPLTTKRQQFLFDTFAWSLYPTYFEEFARPVVYGTPPTPVGWSHSAASSRSFVAIMNLVDVCENGGQYKCAISSTPPVPCIREAAPYDEFGNQIGPPETFNLCNWEVHIYKYNPGSVTIVKDYSVFDPDALIYRDIIIEEYPGGVEDMAGEDPNTEPLETVNDELDDLWQIIMGNSHGGLPEDEDLPPEYYESICGWLAKLLFDGDHNVKHPAFSFDTTYNTSDPTFHHYDQQTQACENSESSCSVGVFNSLVLPYFTYPTFQLKPRLTVKNGTVAYRAYVSPPWAVDEPDEYWFPIGYISQTVVPPGQNWDGAVVNLTLDTVFGLPFPFPAHFLYPGRIARRINTDKIGGGSDDPHFFTHGIGLNHFTTAATANGPIRSRVINSILACANDVAGPEAFKTLDRVAIQYWRDNVQ